MVQHFKTFQPVLILFLDAVILGTQKLEILSVHYHIGETDLVNYPMCLCSGENEMVYFCLVQACEILSL